MSNTIATEQVVCVSSDQLTVCCRGVNSALGHPAVYLTFAEQSTVQCYYCGRQFKRASSENESSQGES